MMYDKFLKNICITLSIIVGFECFSTTMLLASSSSYIFPAGHNSKIIGIGNAIESSGVSSVLYNPANILNTNQKDIEPSDISYLGLELECGGFYFYNSYDHPLDYKLEVTVKSPYLSLGVSYKISDNLYISGIFFPDKYVKTNIEDIPKKIFANVLMNLNANIEELEIQSGIGITYELYSTWLGVSVLHIYEKTNIKISEEETNLIINKLDAYASNFSWIVGIKSKLTDWLNVAISYTPSVIKKYKGDSEFVLNKKNTEPVTDYLPSTLSVGVSFDIPEYLTLSLGGLYNDWKSGKDKLDNKFSNIRFHYDIHNTFDYFISLKKKIFETDIISLGFSYILSPWGGGSFSNDPTDFTVGTDSIRVNNVDRFNIGLSYSSTILSKILYDIGLAYSYGARNVSMEGYNPGKYITKLFTISLGSEYKF